MAVGYKIPKYNPETGMFGGLTINQDNMLDPYIPNYGAMRYEAMKDWTTPDGTNGLKALAGANMPGSSLPSSNPYEDLFNSRMAP